MDLTFVWVLALTCVGALIFLTVFALISFADLESDYINPIDLCRRLNQFVVPEYATHAAVTVMFLCTGCFLEFVLNLTLICWHVRCFLLKKHFLDATTIFSTMNYDRKVLLAKLAFYMASFFFYLYRLVYELVQGVVDPQDSLE